MSDAFDDLPATTALFSANSERLDGLVNGDGYTSTGGVVVPGLPTLLADVTAGASAAEAASGVAQAAATTATGAANSALIAAGSFIDEPTGRAAVADGVAFKVQGDGANIAAYEYRRVSASSSTLIATYPTEQAALSAGGIFIPGSYDRSGVVLAVLDALSRSAIRVNLDGSVDMQAVTDVATKLASLYGTLPDLSTDFPRSGVAGGFRDGSGRLGFYLDVTGTAFAKGRDFLSEIDALKAQAGSNAYTSSAKPLVGIGDSLMAGPNALAWISLVAASIGQTYVNKGIAGQRAEEIAARICNGQAGTQATLATIAGDTIPATTDETAITLSPYSPLRGTANRTLPVTLNGIAGTLHYYMATTSPVAAEYYTFSRSTAGSAVRLIPNTPMIFDQKGGDFNTYLICVGRNNMHPDVYTYAQIKAITLASVAAIVASMRTIDKHFLVLRIPPQTAAVEYLGTTQRANLDDINQTLATLYPLQYTDHIDILLRNGNGSTQDNADIANGVIPSSLMINPDTGVVDTTHPNDTAKPLMASVVTAKLQSLGWE